MLQHPWTKSVPVLYSFWLKAWSSNATLKHQINISSKEFYQCVLQKRGNARTKNSHTKKLFLLQYNLGHSSLNTVEKVGCYVMQVRVFSSLLKHEWVHERIPGSHMLLHVHFILRAGVNGPHLDGSYWLLWGITGAALQYSNYQWI